MTTIIRRPVVFRVLFILLLTIDFLVARSQNNTSLRSSASTIFSSKDILFDQIVCLPQGKKIAKVKNTSDNSLRLILLDRENHIITSIGLAPIYERHRMLNLGDHSAILADLDKNNSHTFNFILVEVVENKLIARYAVDKFLKDSLGKQSKAVSKENVFTAGSFVFLHLTQFAQDATGKISRALEIIVVYHVNPFTPRLDLPHAHIFRFKTAELRRTRNTPINYRSMAPQVASLAKEKYLIYKPKADHLSAFFPVVLNMGTFAQSIEHTRLISNDGIFLIGRSDENGNIPAIRLPRVANSQQPGHAQEFGIYSVRSDTFTVKMQGDQILTPFEHAETKLVIVAADHQRIFCKELPANEPSINSYIGQYAKNLYIVTID